MTCHASGDSRSRSDAAVRCAERTSDSAEPNLSSALQRFGDDLRGSASAISCELAPQATRSRWMRSPLERARRSPAGIAHAAAAAPGSAAASLRRARGSGRARTDCRRRGSAALPAMRRIRTLSVAAAASPVEPALSADTQTSADRTPSPIETARASGCVGDPAEAAGHDGPAVGRRGRKDAQHERARREPALFPHRRGRQPHHFLADIVDAAVVDRARAAARARVGDSSPREHAARCRNPGTPRRRRPRSRVVEPRQHLARASPGRTTMSRCCGICRSSPSRRRDRPAGSRSARAIRPRRSPACWRHDGVRCGSPAMRPGTPSREDAPSSSGSSQSASTRRTVTSSRFRPAIVRTWTWSSLHREIVALDQQKAEIARQIGLLEIGFAEGPGRQQADARLAAVGAGAQAVAERPEERRDALDVQSAIELGKARDSTRRFSSA